MRHYYDYNFDKLFDISVILLLANHWLKLSLWSLVNRSLLLATTLNER